MLIKSNFFCLLPFCAWLSFNQWMGHGVKNGCKISDFLWIGKISVEEIAI